MKLIFLDFDGVLNTPLTWSNHLKDDGALAIDKDKVERLNDIVEATGAQVVISSAWRIGRTVEQLQALLNKRGATFKIVDKTTSNFHERWKQILAYLKPLPRGVKFVILDDMMEAGWGFSKNFVNTNPETGITQADAEKAIQILS